MVPRSSVKEGLALVAGRHTRRKQTKGTTLMLNTMIQTIKNLRADKKAVTALEYGLIASLIAVAIIGAVSTLGTNISKTFNAISAQL